MPRTSIQDCPSGAKAQWRLGRGRAPRAWGGFQRWIAAFSILLLSLSIFAEIFPDYCPRINQPGMAMEMMSGTSMDAAMVSDHAPGNPGMGLGCVALRAAVHAPEGLQAAHVSVPAFTLLAIIVFLLSLVEIGNVLPLREPAFLHAESPPLHNIRLLI
ncbi:hypothetical protein AB4090_14675 [Acidithiobacillus sp. IBUN Pt1247-S3]|uniref:hypothetical protein n=1 Tax=Acidithiobacillus sp. IBUN Pt1247-S3 TaxID=3166642 RepID=UPI0034E58526